MQACMRFLPAALGWAASGAARAWQERGVQASAALQQQAAWRGISSGVCSEPSPSQPTHQDKDVTIWEAGTAAAQELVKAARWAGLDDPRIFDVSGPSSPHLAPDLHGKLDVVVVKSSVLDWPVGADKARFCAIPRKECPPGVNRWNLPDFNTQFLREQCGFRTITRSCVVLHVPEGAAAMAASAGIPSSPAYPIKGRTKGLQQHQQQPAPLPRPPPPRILCLFLNGHTLPELSAAVSGHHELYASMAQTFYPSDDRPGLFMGGIRCNERQGRPGSFTFSTMPPDALNVGYYSAMGHAARLSLADPHSRVHSAIRTTCVAKADMEAAVAPLVAQRRLGVAELLQHPGILPDVPRHQVPAFAVGASKGFVNHIHADQMYGGLTGTITWNTSRMQPGAGHTFCVWSAKLLFDLQAHHASMVMIPGDVPHGTPGLPPPPASSQPSGAGAQGKQLHAHEGIGVVMITTDNLSTASAKEQLHLLNSRIHDHGPYGRSFEQYRHSRLYMSRSAMYCRTCGEGGRPVPCGDKLCTLADEAGRERQRQGGGSAGGSREDGGSRH